MKICDVSSFYFRHVEMQLKLLSILCTSSCGQCSVSRRLLLNVINESSGGNALTIDILNHNLRSYSTFLFWPTLYLCESVLTLLP